MKKKIKNFISLWKRIILKYEVEKVIDDDSPWWGKSVTFSMINIWFLAFIITLIIFISQYWPVGRYMVETVSGIKFIIVLPVMLVVVADFFIMTWVMVGGIMMVFGFMELYLVAILFLLLFKILGSNVDLDKIIKASFYSTAVLSLLAIPLFLIILFNRGILPDVFFWIGFNLTYVFIVLFMSIWWVKTGEKILKLSTMKSALAVLVPLITVILFGIMLNIKILPKLIELLH